MYDGDLTDACRGFGGPGHRRASGDGAYTDSRAPSPGTGRSLSEEPGEDVRNGFREYFRAGYRTDRGSGSGNVRDRVRTREPITVETSWTLVASGFFARPNSKYAAAEQQAICARARYL